MAREQTTHERRCRLEQIVESFDSAMLVTLDQDLLHARPMRITGRVTDSELWFMAGRGSTEAEGIDRDTRAAVVMQGNGLFASLSGTASIHDGHIASDQLSQMAMRPWFPGVTLEGPLVPIRFVPHEGEYWDTTGIEAIKYVFRTVKASILGEPLDARAPSVHGSVAM